MNSQITFSHISFAWPDGRTQLDDFCVSLNAGRTGVVGANGTGKTTILRLIAGELRPTSGELVVGGEVAYVPQQITEARTTTIADMLGISAKLAARRAIEDGSIDPRDFEVLADDWDVDTRARQVLGGLPSLDGVDLGRPAATLSGGEAMCVAIAGCRLRGAAITLLDEPTNNLDDVLRDAVLKMVREWPGTLIVASHDAELLELMDFTAELYDGRLTVFGGTYSQWQAALAVDQAAARQAVVTAKEAVRAARRQREAVLERAGKNLAQGKKKAIAAGVSLGARHAMRNTAEAGAGRARGTADERVADAARALAETQRRLRDDEHIRLELPDPGVHASRQILEVTWGDDGRYLMRGPERVALAGRNGVGKTTLIEASLGRGRPAASPIMSLLTNRVGYLPQRLCILDDEVDAVTNVLAVAPGATSGQVRARLAGLLIRGDAVFRPVGHLSGGERFRVALARLLFAEPP
ncbi:MAG: ATP-binding cassette domain-containing protein, partial [Micrococcales bacterium]|nr:ATP-binding cassette domain-containing protein [Micrococcales bacterium]